MESAIGALGSPDDVFQQRYHDFFDNLLPDSSSLAFAILASYINRLTPEMFRSIQQKIQTKIVEASRLDSSEGIVFFAWSALKKQPKILSYNQDSFRNITWKALEWAFVQRFVKDDPVGDDSVFEVPFALFSTLYANEWKNITGSITVVAKKKPPYKQDSILNIPLLNEYGGSKKFKLLYFLWALLENVVVHSSKSFKLNVEYVLKVLEITLSLRHRYLCEKAFATIITIARTIKTNFAIYIDRVLFILQTATIPSNITYNFLINLLEELGPLAEISKVYTSAVFKFANAIDKSGNEDASQSLEIIGRQEHSNELLNDLRIDENDEEEDFDNLFDLVICVLENIPTFLPVPYIKRIQMGICKRLLHSRLPSARDLRLLNALLAFRNECVPSPIQVARSVYSWSSIYKTPELAPFIKIGKALCDTQRSVRMNTFFLFDVEEKVVLPNGVNTIKTNSKDVNQSPKPLPASSTNLNLLAQPPKPASALSTNRFANPHVHAEPPQPTPIPSDDLNGLAQLPKETPPPSKNVPARSPNKTSTSSTNLYVHAESPQPPPTNIPAQQPKQNATPKNGATRSSNSTPPANIPAQSPKQITTPSKPLANDDDDDDCMIIDEVQVSPLPNRKRNAFKRSDTPPPSKKTTNEKSIKVNLSIPEMLQDLFPS